jgi:hypothetical protein
VSGSIEGGIKAFEVSYRPLDRDRGKGTSTAPDPGKPHEEGEEEGRHVPAFIDVGSVETKESTEHANRS